jgi:hypothetical protein
LLTEPRNRIEGVGQAGLERPPLIGELKPIGMTAEEREPEVFFQETHHVAHSRLSNIQLLRRCFEAAKPSSRFEGSQSIQ